MHNVLKKIHENSKTIIIEYYNQSKDLEMKIIINRIVLISNNDKRIQSTDSIETFT